jgi:hypothetical protein
MADRLLRFVYGLGSVSAIRRPTSVPQKGLQASHVDKIEVDSVVNQKGIFALE